ncbi:NAD(P)H oxidoreductase [Candidatus Gracilibacteria bacterium]|nr:NAD(P)H oxidoreductase [Candidatus Gracilibacteria bacterium]
MQILLLFAHPALEKSRVHRQLIKGLDKLPGITFHDLYEHYPRFDIDVQREQELLLAHDLIVLQHPLYWYSTPALVKQWEDLVLEHGWAYGSNGRALEGKKFLSVVTSGGRAEAYTPDGLSRFTIREYLRPIEQTAVLCRMEYLPPFVLHGAHRLEGPMLLQTAETYRYVLLALRDDRLDLHAARRYERLNDDLDAVLKPEVALGAARVFWPRPSSTC